MNLAIIEIIRVRMTPAFYHLLNKNSRIKKKGNVDKRGGAIERSPTSKTRKRGVPGWLSVRITVNSWLADRKATPEVSRIKYVLIRKRRPERVETVCSFNGEDLDKRSANPP